MLQQTQTKRVLEYYPRFLKKFPTFAALAQAPLAEVLQAWQGLGYNRRGKNLWLLAQEVEGHFFGQLPRETSDLLSLPGIGAYTAAALQAFAFMAPSPMIETNIRTVFLLEFFKSKESVSDKEILPLIEKTLYKKNPRVWFYALMDYGAHLKKVHPKLNKKSRHFRPQSKFQGSVRQVRGAILRAVLQLTKVSESDLAEHIEKPSAQIAAPLQALIAEGLLEKKGKFIRIPDQTLNAKRFSVHRPSPRKAASREAATRV
jgi:A/G-specific adenine glycosylase